MIYGSVLFQCCCSFVSVSEGREAHYSRVGKEPVHTTARPVTHPLKEKTTSINYLTTLVRLDSIERPVPQ